MKLLELLIKELPVRGGWPGSVPNLVQDSAGRIYQAGGGKPFFLLERSSDWEVAEISCEHYMDNLLALKPSTIESESNPVWNGQGLPPVGVECEYQDIDGWVKTKILCVDGDIIFHKRNCSYSFDSSCFFRPIRTESDLKRDEFANACIEIDRKGDYSNSYAFFCGVYDAIAAVKIPGVELSK